MPRRCLDGFNVWNPPDPGTADAIKSRVVANFVGADIDAAKFNTGLQRLIGALRK